MSSLSPTPPRSRWAPSEQDLMLLERTFAHAPFPDARLRASLAQELQVEARQVQVWFQNPTRPLRSPATREPYQACQDPS